MAQGPRFFAGRWVVIFLALWGGQGGLLFAQGPPIYTDTAIMLGLEGRGIRTFSEWRWMRSAAPSGAELRVWSNPVVVPYNLFSDRFQIIALVPFLNLRRKAGQVEAERTGVGDVRILLKRLFVQRDGRQRTFRVAVKAGVELPTGDQDAPALGSGTTDWLAGLVATGIRRRWGLYGEALFQRNGTTANLNRGDVFQLKAALAYRLVPVVYRRYPAKTWNGFLELLYWHGGRDRLADRLLEESGGWMLSLAQGLQFTGGRRWLLEAGIQWPLSRNFPENQPALRWSLRAGTRILLF